jgi:hypothetical protein
VPLPICRAEDVRVIPSVVRLAMRASELYLPRRSGTSASGRSLISSPAIKPRADVQSEAVQNCENKPELRVSAENIALVYYTGF